VRETVREERDGKRGRDKEVEGDKKGIWSG